MVESDRSLQEENAALKGELLKGKARYLALGAAVYSIKPDWFRPGSTPLDWFFDAPEFTTNPVPGADGTEPSPLPPAAQVCVTRYSQALGKCDAEGDPDSCRSEAWQSYQDCMAAVVTADPISPGTWDPPKGPGPGIG